MAHFMHPTWCAKEQTKANRIWFRDSRNTDELHVDYIMHQKMHLTLLQHMRFDQVIQEIIISAPSGWESILCIDDLGGQWTEFINRVHQHSHSLIESKSGSNLLWRVEQLEHGKSNHFKPCFTKQGTKFKKDKKGKFKAHTREAKVGDCKDLP